MIVRLCGGLGNTFFQYAFGRALSLRLNVPVQSRWLDRHEPYTLQPYAVQVDHATSIYNPPVYRDLQFTYDPDVFKQPQDTYFDGVWQTERYFDDAEITSLIRAELTLQNVRPEVEKVADRLRDCQSVFIHVRHGDFSNTDYHGTLKMHYYKIGVDYIRERVPDAQFFVFSDDIPYCREQFPDFEIISRPDFNRHEDLYLMSQCQHSIVANSTFSWWAAWLSDQPGKIVIAPDRWFGNAPLDARDVIPDRWIKI